jgi:hypothetical protein
MKTKAFLIAFLLLPLIAISQNVNIGDILCTDGSIISPDGYLSSGRTAKGVVFYVDESNQHGWAVQLDYQGGVLWSSSYDDIPTLTNYQKLREAINDFDGYENTRKIRQAGNASTYPAAWTVDFDHGWYLPAAGQIRYLYGYIPEVNSSLNLVGGTPFALSIDWWLWASTECNSEDAWDINSQGNEGHSKKGDHAFYVRAMINF